MLPSLRAAAVTLALVLGATAVAAADDAALWGKLGDGGRVALVRHAATAGGTGDPPGFRLDDCTTQRNLSDKGRAQARALGVEMRSRNIPVGKLLSSQWCRCRETAALMALGVIEEAATFNNAYVLREQREELTRGAREAIAAWKGPGTLVVVTHGSNILALTGIHPAEGGIVVVEPDAAAREKFRTLGQIRPASQETRS